MCIRDRYKVRDAIEVRTPIMNDSINPRGEKHSTKMLLKTPVVLGLPDAPLQSLTVDTAGYLTLDKADKNSKICVLKTPVSYTHLDVYKRQLPR